MLLLLQKKTENVKEEGMPLTQLGFLLLKYLDQSNSRRKGFVPPYSSQVTIHRQTKSRRNSRLGPGGRNWCRGYGGMQLTGCSPWHASLLSYSIQDYQPSSDTIHKVLPPKINH